MSSYVKIGHSRTHDTRTLDYYRGTMIHTTSSDICDTSLSSVIIQDATHLPSTDRVYQAPRHASVCAVASFEAGLGWKLDTSAREASLQTIEPSHTLRPTFVNLLT